MFFRTLVLVAESSSPSLEFILGRAPCLGHFLPAVGGLVRSRSSLFLGRLLPAAGGFIPVLSSSFGRHSSPAVGGFETGCICSCREHLIDAVAVFAEASVGRVVLISSLWDDGSPSDIFNLSEYKKLRE